jgi:HK97 family phage major capsid protein
MPTAKELRASAAQIHEGTIVPLLAIESRSAEQETSVNKAFADVDRLIAEAEKQERSANLAAKFAATTKPANDGIGDQKPEQRDSKQLEAEQRSAFWNYCFNGESNLSKEERALLQRPAAEKRTTGQLSGAPFAATASWGSGSAGGFLVPVGFQRELEVAMKAYGNLLGDCRVLDTATGQPLYWPTVNDTTQEAAVVGEADEVTEQDVTFGNTVFGAYKFKSGLVRMSLELQQDAFESIEDIVKNLFAIRFGRGLNRAFTTGNGSTEPTGILTAIDNNSVPTVETVGDFDNTGISGHDGTNSIGYEDLVNLLHGVDPAYRDNPSSKFVMHDQTLSQLRKILDKFGRPIWQPGVATAAPSTILDKPYSINQQMPLISGHAIVAGNPVIVFGDLQKFVIRRVREMSIMRLVERYAEFGQTALLAFARYDSNLVDAGTHPVTYLKMATS